ncbi:MAG: phytanoyl-CoA dioxygenase family protein [Geminicoccaceae bacterium]
MDINDEFDWSRDSHSGEFAYPLADRAALRAHYVDQGYVVVRGAVPRELCARALAAFEREVKPSRDYFKRHASSDFERHVFTEAGFMKYPIMNIQDLPGDRFRAFRDGGLEMLAHRSVREVTTSLLGEPGRMIHTMYFDGNQKTWAHRDSHYIDSEETGRMIGVWIAAEDIDPGAGRFYVYARSHVTPTPTDLKLDELDPNGPEYKRRMEEFAGGSSLRLVAPALRQGDMILWSSLAIHGSLETTRPDCSRRSFTAHYIPCSQTYLWGRRARGSVQEIVVDEVPVTLHGDRPLGSFGGALRVGERALMNRAPGMFRVIKSAKNSLLGKRARP